MALERHKASKLHTVISTVGIAMALSCQGHVSGSSVHAASPSEGIAMQVRPRLCVLASGQSVCVMQFSVSWTAPAATDVCLTLTGKQEPLRCWQERRAGEFEMQVEWQESALVQLRDANSDALLLEEQIPIISRDKRDMRTRRRHAWSIL